MIPSPLRALERRYWRRRRAEGPPTRPVAVVTGGSEGIGLAIAARLVAADHDVLLVARGAEGLGQAARMLSAAGRAGISTLALDITAPDAPARIEAELVRHGGHCDVLVNNAGTGLAGPFDSHPPDAIRSLVDVNVVALTALCRHVLPAMRDRRGGAIINIASMGGLVPGPNQAAYYASKAYVISLSEALASEVACDCVRVLAVAPGPVETAFHRRMGSEASLYLKLLPVQSPAAVARYAMLGLLLGGRLVVPGIIQPVLALSLRLLPHRLSVPLVGWLLKVRKGQSEHAPRRHGE